jgi:hypothetical protein
MKKQFWEVIGKIAAYLSNLSWRKLDVIRRIHRQRNQKTHR